MSNVVGSEASVYQGTIPISGKVVFNSSSNSPSSPSVQVPSERPDKIPNRVRVLREKNSSLPRSKEGTQLVDKQHRTEQWEVPYFETPTDNYSNRCIKDGLGGLLPWGQSRGTMDQRGKHDAHQYSGAQGSDTSHTVLHKGQEIPKQYSYTDGQYGGPLLLSKNGGYGESRSSDFEQENMAVFDIQADHSYCRTPARNPECRSRLRVKELEGLKRVETRPNNFQKALQPSRSTQSRSICLPSVSSGTEVLCLEERPLQSGQGCISGPLGSGTELCLPTVLLDRENSVKDREREISSVDNHPSMAVTAMVPKDFGIECPVSFSSPTDSKFVIRPIGGKTPTARGQNFTSNGLDSFRKELSKEGISKRASILITEARREGTISNYKSAWGKWDRWCSGRQIDPFTCDLKFVLDFLADLFEQGFSYNWIGTHRSAISSYHIPIEGLPVAQHARICALITGVFNKRPPTPKYTFIWDVEIVFKILKSIPSDSLTDKLLTFKLTTLLALTAASRASEITNLDIRYLNKQHTVYAFTFCKVSKSWKKGKKAPVLEFKMFDDPSICVCRTIDMYLKRSAGWRGEQDTQLLLATIEPHKPVVTSTVSGWLVKTLSLAGIDTTVFKGHSTRSASTTKALSQGVSIEEILKTAQWSSESTFRKFYYKEQKVKKDFQSKVSSLKNHNIC